MGGGCELVNTIYQSDLPRMVTAMAEWCACLTIIAKYPRRYGGPRLWGLLGAGLAVQCLFLTMTDALHIILWLPCMMAAVGLMLALIAACCDMPLTSAAYCTVRAFLLAEFAASLGWQLYSYTRYALGWQDAETKKNVLAAAILAAVFAVVFFGMYWLEKRRADPRTAMAFQFKELWSPVLMALACFFLSNLSFVYSDTPFTSSELTDIYNIRTLVDLAGVTMLYAYHVQRCELYMQRELDAIQHILQNQYIQYRQSRESIEVINHKYHDLKHQIAVLRAEQDDAKRIAYLDGMEEEIRDYEAQNKTGNSVLDTVLTGKSLYCARHGVELTCVADGARLEFMDVMDICTIFGNILDNAIECELRIEDKGKRLIHLAVYARKDFLVIRCENYCPEEIEFQDGLPVSTKRDAVYHGYGIKSIRHAAGKYGGAMTVHSRDEWFEINLMIPLAAGIAMDRREEAQR